MPKLKRTLRREDPETQEPVASPTVPGNPFNKWLVGAAVLTLAVVGLPVMIWAQTKPQVKTDVQQGKVMVDASALKRITESLKELQKAVDDLNGSQKAVKQDLANQQDGRAACLNTCRQTLVKCQAKDATDEKTSAGLPPCLSQANECITKCNNVPRPPISCEDRCAVAMGGCLEKALVGSPGAIEACKKNNAECLVKACKIKDGVLPAEYCSDQCSRFAAICRAGMSAYDTAGAKDCETLEENCVKSMCQQPAATTEPSAPASSTTSTALPPLKPIDSVTATPPKPAEGMTTSTVPQE